jgi:putative hydroxymethylpyrimidine transport system ATP-binding protein
LEKIFGIRIKAHRIAFDGHTLFDKLDFSLPAGQWTCLLGPSGVGKSTLLRLIAGLANEAGPASISCDDGKPLSGRTAYMGQQDLLLPWLSVIDNVTLGRRLRAEDPKGSEAQSRAKQLLDAVGLTGYEHSLPATLSGGMRQRAALARTLMENRPVVLMDEPFSAIDAITRLRLQELAADLLRDRTVLLVTHDPLEALRLGDRIHVLSGRPVVISDAVLPTGSRPRPAGDPDLLTKQAKLLGQLSAAMEDTAAA